MCDAHAEKTRENVSALKREGSMPRYAVLFVTAGVLGRVFRAFVRDFARDFSSLTA
jgi:uncharacterized SAM-dependent methyltransferase